MSASKTGNMPRLRLPLGRLAAASLRSGQRQLSSSGGHLAGIKPPHLAGGLTCGFQSHSLLEQRVRSTVTSNEKGAAEAAPKVGQPAMGALVTRA